MTAAMQLENKGIVKGIVKGLVKGKQEEREKFVLNLFRLNQTIKFISQATGLPICTVQEIKQSLNTKKKRRKP